MPSTSAPQLDLAGVQHPGETFRGRKVLQPRGKSWVPWLTSKTEVVHDENAIHGWEREPFVIYCSFSLIPAEPGLIKRRGCLRILIENG
jgi:hypothetical protein